MKIIFNPLIDGLSGKLGDYVISSFNKIVDIKGKNKVSGTIRTIGSYIHKTTVRTQNVQNAFKIAASTWKTLSKTEQETWKSDARKVSNTHDVLRSGRSHFIGFAITVYASTMSSFVIPASFVNTAGKDFNERLTFIWN